MTHQVTIILPRYRNISVKDARNWAPLHSYYCFGMCNSKLIFSYNYIVMTRMCAGKGAVNSIKKLQ